MYSPYSEIIPLFFIRFVVHAMMIRCSWLDFFLSLIIYEFHSFFNAHTLIFLQFNFDFTVELLASRFVRFRDYVAVNVLTTSTTHPENTWLRNRSHLIRQNAVESVVLYDFTVFFRVNVCIVLFDC